MEIDITDFFKNADAYDFSGSVMERGPDAGPQTWANAMREAEASPLLTTPEQLDALRDHVKSFGAWERAEIDAWSPEQCNAIFIQLISGDMREAGMDDSFADEFDWEAYGRRVEAGTLAGSIYRGDIDGSLGQGRIFYYLGA